MPSSTASSSLAPRVTDAASAFGRGRQPSSGKTTRTTRATRDARPVRRATHVAGAGESLDWMNDDFVPAGKAKKNKKVPKKQAQAAPPKKAAAAAAAQPAAELELPSEAAEEAALEASVEAAAAEAFEGEAMRTAVVDAAPVDVEE